MLELIINKEEDKRTIMLIENGNLVEKHEEHENKRRLEGDIYIGTVENVLNGLQSAFIDIGEDKNTFIRIKDLLPKQDESNGKKADTDIQITKLAKKGMNIVVQVKRDGTETKGARVSTHINLPGRFVALMPNTNFVTISQKIEEEEEINRLKNIVKKHLPESMGAVIRTACLNVEEEEIKKDIDNLIEKWKDIEKRKNDPKIKAPTILYNNQALLRRTIIDIIDMNLNKISVNDKETYERVRNLLKEFEDRKDIQVVLKNSKDLLDNLDSQLKRAENRKIWLKCGGYITIDRTEALTAIDVNTGKYTGTEQLQKTIYKVNSEATIEIAKQLRIRDIGGIIIIDYIDMDEENKIKILELLKENLKKDRSKTQILGFTALNLLEMTRKNMCNNDYY